jgi:hypothetical protein
MRAASSDEKPHLCSYGLCPRRNNPLEGATQRDNLIDCACHHFMYDVQSENYFPKNVYPNDYPKLQEQAPPRTYPVELRDSEVWVDLG